MSSRPHSRGTRHTSRASTTQRLQHDIVSLTGQGWQGLRGPRDLVAPGHRPIGDTDVSGPQPPSLSHQLAPWSPAPAFWASHPGPILRPPAPPAPRPAGDVVCAQLQTLQVCPISRPSGPAPCTSATPCPTLPNLQPLTIRALAPRSPVPLSPAPCFRAHRSPAPLAPAPLAPPLGITVGDAACVQRGEITSTREPLARRKIGDLAENIKSEDSICRSLNPKPLTIDQASPALEFHFSMRTRYGGVSMQKWRES